MFDDFGTDEETAACLIDDTARRVIGFVDTIASSGKTYAAVTFSCEKAGAEGARFIIAQPSRVLIDQTYADVQVRFPGVGCEAIHGGTDPKVLRGIISALAKFDLAGKAIY